MGQMFGRTLREAPADAETASHGLLVRAGFIQQLGAGVYSLLPLGKRSIDKIEAILREEMVKIGGQEVLMPVVNPADVWKETRRFYEIGDEMSRFHDRVGRDMVLAMTHEEVVADLTRKVIHSYKQLPLLVFHIQTKWRDDARPRAGLIRVREFTMKDSYSLDSSEEGLDTQYRAHYQAYFDIFNRCGLPTVAVLSDVGMMGGKMAHEYMYLTPIGEDTIIICDSCGYHANRQIAQFRKPEPEGGDPAELRKIETPGTTTIEELCEFLKIDASRTLKAVFMTATLVDGEEEVQKLVVAMIRGDMELNETKLANLVKAKELRPAHEEEIKAAGAYPGYGSPIGVEGALIAVDDLVPDLRNLVTGANEEGFHVENANYGRDFEADFVGDLIAAGEGSLCANCDGTLRATRAVEVGNIFKLGTRYTGSLGATFLDDNGKAQQVIMGSYGIGVGRLLACAVEEYHDDKGVIWPISIAPYEVHLVALPGGEEEADRIYENLSAKGVEVLYDDRKEQAGVKFNDADLIGVPIRVTASKRSLKNGGLEMKLRRGDDLGVVPVDDAVDKVLELKSTLEQELADRVKPVEFSD
ncbi:proline--tRNA ligase [Acidobacteria bacterium Mor1]|nr:proline--tRNA ligase [Acidobacteria bacterium Mor1]